MPYVRDESAARIQAGGRPITTGELNYALTLVIIQYCLDRGLCYDTINDVVGALEGAKAEFQRRVVAPYENDCIMENGDVYPVELTVGKV